MKKTSESDASCGHGIKGPPARFCGLVALVQPSGVFRAPLPRRTVARLSQDPPRERQPNDWEVRR